MHAGPPPEADGLAKGKETAAFMSAIGSEAEREPEAVTPGPADTEAWKPKSGPPAGPGPLRRS